MKFSDHDRALLHQLQTDCTLSMADLARVVGIGASTAWRKVQDFQASGLIRRRVAVLDPKKAGLGLCVFASVQLEDHSEAAIRDFTRIIDRHPEILEAHALSGTSDYILKVRCADVEAYEAFMSHNLLRSPVVRTVVSSFSLRQIKETTELPL